MLFYPQVNFVHVRGFVAERSQRWLRSFSRVLRKHPVTAIVVLAFLALVGTGGGLYCYALQQWHAAQQAVKERRPEEARSSLKVCLSLWPRSVPVHLLAARAARFRRDFPEAESHLNRCLEVLRGRKEGAMAAAVHFLLDPKGASMREADREEATQAVQLEFLLMRVEAGEEDEVAPALFAYVDSGHPETPLILETMARACMYNLRLGGAYVCLSMWIDYYQNGGELTPDAAKPYHWRAWVQERLDNTEGAMEDYQRALELDPDLFPVRLRLAELLLESFKTVEALPHLERVTRQYPDNPEVLARLGYCLVLQGRGDEARRVLEGALEKLPDDVPTLRNLAKLDLQDGRLPAAEARLRYALKVDPADPETLYTLYTTVNLSPNRRQEADAVLDQYYRKSELLRRVNVLLRDEAKRPSNDPNILSELGDLLIRVEREKTGFYWLDQALQLDPGHQPTHKVLAEYHESKGEWEKAAAHRSRLSAPNTKAAGR